MKAKKSFVELVKKGARFVTGRNILKEYLEGGHKFGSGRKKQLKYLIIS